MANRKNVVPRYKIEHDTTAERLAYVYEVNDIGNIAVDMENGHSYLITSSGAGANSAKNLTANDYISMPVSLYSIREVDANSDVGNIVANGGILASDTTPLMEGDSNNSAQIKWATGNVDPVGFQQPMPLDITGTSLIDGTRNMYIILEVFSGTTNKASFTVTTSPAPLRSTLVTCSPAGAVAGGSPTGTACSRRRPRRRTRISSRWSTSTRPTTTR